VGDSSCDRFEGFCGGEEGSTKTLVNKFDSISASHHIYLFAPLKWGEISDIFGGSERKGAGA